MKDSDEHLKTDEEFSRGVYIDLIETSRQGIQEMADIADQLGHPRAYEVLSSMIKQTAEVTDKLMDLHKKKRDLMKRDEPKQLENRTTNNNLYIGTTSDFQNELMRLEDDDVIDGQLSPTDE